MAAAPAADAIVMAAAVADFRPKAPATDKLKKDTARRSWPSSPRRTSWRSWARREAGTGPDGVRGGDPDVEAAGAGKLARKHLDLLVANEVGREGTGFGAAGTTPRSSAPATDGVPLRDWTKAELAQAVVDRIAARLGRR